MLRFCYGLRAIGLGWQVACAAFAIRSLVPMWAICLKASTLTANTPFQSRPCRHGWSQDGEREIVHSK